MSTTVVPLNPSPFDPVATAELERIVVGLTEQEYLTFRAEVRAVYEACPPELRHLLVVIEDRDDSHLVIDAMRWTADGRLEAAPRRTLRVQLLDSIDQLPRRT